MSQSPPSTRPSFTNAAVITLVLYLVGIVPGYIANWLYFREARDAERVEGTRLPGVGSLA